jgi:serine/threonine protein kinase
MPDNKSLSQLISKSLSGQLSVEQAAAVESELSSSEQSRRFARLSSLIQDSLSDVAARSLEGDEDIAPGLSEDAKARLKDSVRGEQLRRSHGDLLPTITSEMQGDQTYRSSSGHFPPVKERESRRSSSRFTLIKPLGEGGLGQVWLARDETLKRSVALKEMTLEAAQFPRAWDRFYREAEITGHLEHPNIVPLYHFGTDPDSGTPFYAMRFVGKRTLVDAIQEYHDRRQAGEEIALDLHKLLTAFIGVCHAIAYAHSRGVIHRDLKPENVALDNFGQVIVLDWGLAKVSADYDGDSILSGHQVTSDSALGQTLAGEVIGTPLYMAPEQAAGDLESVDHRTDVYGLGAILFAMLTGSAPHENSSLSSGTRRPVGELLKTIASESSPRARDYLNDIPSGLEEICSRAMQFKQHSRYQTVTELADAVESWMAGRNARRQQYANVRGEGRELKTSMLSFVRDLERNVRFMASLPPIQGVVNVQKERSDDDLNVWRERLGVIFKGLLRTNCDFCSVSYCEVTDLGFQELLRVERQSTDFSNVRSIPASRLASGPLTDCMQRVMDGTVDEVRVSLTSKCHTPSSRQSGYLVAGVPIFDEHTEEPFGFVMIEAALVRLTESFIRNRLRSTNRIFLLDNDCHVLIQMNRDGSRDTTYDGQLFSQVCSSWQDVLPVLKEKGEFLDEQDHAFYATRVDLVPGHYSLALVLGAHSPHAP